MNRVELVKGVYWVGAIDWNVKNFHGHTYTTKRGTTYNAYLIVDDKIALVDTVYDPFAAELIERIKEIVPPEKIDYVIANHVERDHSGALPEIMKLCPKAKVLGTAKCKEGLYKHYFGNCPPENIGGHPPTNCGGWDFQIVKTGDKLNLGKKTITFLEAPMLHWPDSMFTYLVEDALLLPNDAFGQHYATSERFADEVDQAVLMEEAKKYYANILWPLSSLVLKKIAEVQKLGIPIKMIAPSHGLIWRKDPLQIVNTYATWASNTTKPKVVIVYETMWQATEILAQKISQGIIDSNMDVKLYDIATSDRTQIIGDMLDAKGYIIGSSTHDNDMLTTIAGFLEFLKGLRPKNRIACAFGSYGWAGGAVANIEKSLRETGIEITQPGLGIQFVPDVNELKHCYEFGKNFAKTIDHRP